MIINRTLSPEESTLVFSQVQGLRTVDCYHARALVQSQNETEQWHIEVDYRSGRWFAASENGHTDEFHDGVTFHGGKAVDRPTTISDELPPPLESAFPETLPWWGGHDHGFRPVLLESVGKKSVLLTFEHGSDPSMRSTMVVDTEIGVVTRVMHFNSPYVVLLDIEPGRQIERIAPESFPKLEVVYPSY